MTINREAVQNTIESIAHSQYAFDMETWAQPVMDGENNICGTACCLAGHIMVGNGYRTQWSERKGYMQFIHPEDGAVVEGGYARVALNLLGLGAEHEGVFYKFRWGPNDAIAWLQGLLGDD